MYRDLRALGTGTRAQCESMVRRLGIIDAADGIARLYRIRAGTTLPRREHFIVAGPAGATPKARRGFAAAWQQMDHEQLVLAGARVSVAP